MITKDVLETLERRNVLTEAGKCWLQRALDPFHDFELNCKGMPDSDTSRVVVEEFNQSISLAAPPNATGNWDVNVFTLPIGNRAQVQPSVDVNASISAMSFDGTSLMASNPYNGLVAMPTNGFAVNLGLLTAIAVLPGRNTLPTTSNGSNFPVGTPNADFTVSSINPPTNVLGRRRLIAAGFEVHNTTAPMYRQGTVTVYRVPQSSRQQFKHAPFYTTTMAPIRRIGVSPTSATAANTPFGTPVGMMYDTFDMPPATLSDAMQYPGSRQWAAEEGVYCVCAMDVKRNNLTMPDEKPIAFYDGEQITGEYVGVNGPSGWDVATSGYNTVGLATPTAGYQGTTIAGRVVHSYTDSDFANNVLRIPFHTSGAIFTGLSRETTLTVTLRTTWEVSPLDGDATALLPLAKPSPEYDPIAFELYQRALTKLPPGVPVHMNAAGDFWDWTLKVLAAAVPTITAAVVPSLAPVGGLAGSALEQYRQKRNKPKPDKPQPDISVFKSKQLPNAGAPKIRSAPSAKKR